jgi:hypothetical protein
MSKSDQLGRRCTIEPNCSVLSTRLAGVSVIHEHVLEACDPTCVPEAAKSFFIPVVHNPLGVIGYVVAPELSSRGGRAWSHETRGSVGAHLDREARSEPEEHMATLELNSARRRGPRPWNT